LVCALLDLDDADYRAVHLDLAASGSSNHRPPEPR
jgi:hypothetical protein